MKTVLVFVVLVSCRVVKAPPQQQHSFDPQIVVPATQQRTMDSSCALEFASAHTIRDTIKVITGESGDTSREGTCFINAQRHAQWDAVTRWRKPRD